MERKRNGGSPWWILFREPNDEFTFVGPYDEKTAKTLSKEYGGFPARETPSLRDKELMNLDIIVED